MKYLNQEIEHELTSRGAKLVRFVSIAHLDEKQNRKLPNAIVFAFPLTADYVRKVVDTPNYVQARIEDHYNFDDDEYTIAGVYSYVITELFDCNDISDNYYILKIFHMAHYARAICFRNLGILNHHIYFY